ncbi:plasmid pRiA4b ORF-3 family protein, partial [Patescibacteria group bacterium]|nr:plasmid pRiA4b ORF-3 family protein [Patescibacteria group bacterium]
MTSSQQNKTEHDKEWHERHPFLLPDGRGISKTLVDELCEAIATDISKKYYLNTSTLEVVQADVTSNHHNGEQMQLIPHADTLALRQIMENALEIMQYPLFLEQEDNANEKIVNEKLEQLLQDKTLSAVDIEKEMYKTHPTYMGAWDQGKADYLWEVMEEWLCASPIKAKENSLYWFSDEDCPVCEYMRSAEEGWISPTIEGLHGVMDQVNQKQEDDLFMKSRNMDKTNRKGGKEKERSIFQFKITLNYSTPRIWRRVLLPSDSTFFELHLAIQDAMGWSDYHLHDFVVDRKGKRPLIIRLPNLEFNEPCDQFDLDERKEKICDYFNVIVKQCQYEYDFGDGWDHTVLFERELPVDGSVASYPRCTSGKNACPPEDSCGVHGYADLQRILKNPKHPEYKNLIDWLYIDNGDEFDPYTFSPEEVEFRNSCQALKEIENYSGIAPLGQSEKINDMQIADLEKPQNVGVWEFDWKDEQASELFPMI